MSILNERYQLLEKLGAGGMGEVYRGMQIQLDREVAIKFVRPAMTDSAFTTRFEREAKAIAQLSHPNIVQVHDFDINNEHGHFMVMELLRGEDLSRQLQEREFSLKEAITITRAVGQALSYAHTRGIVHRDIKPSNIFITSEERIVVTDFGLVKMLHEASITGTETTVGTPHYFAPEQAGGGPVDHRIDIYALGAVFYQLVTGHVPYDADSTLAIIAQHIHAPIPDPREARPDLPPAITAVIKRAMAKDPADRYQNLQSFIADLENLLQNQPSAQETLLLDSTPTANTLEDIVPDVHPPTRPAQLPRRPILLTGVAAVAIIVVLLGLMLRGGDSGDEAEENGTIFDLSGINIAPAHDSEYLYLVADFAGDETVGSDASARIAANLRTGSLAVTLGEAFRLEQVDIIVTSSQEAEALAAATNALIVVWGTHDSTGLQITVQAHGYPERTLSSLSFLVPAGDTYNQLIVNDAPFIASVYAEQLSVTRLLLDDELVDLLMLYISQQERQPIELGIIPSTPLDNHMLQNALGAQDNEALDNAITDALALVPDDPALLFTRFSINAFSMGQMERAQIDADKLLELLPDSAVAHWMVGAMLIFEDDYESLVNLTDDFPETEGQAQYMLAFYRLLALEVLGEFEIALTEAEALDTEVITSIMGFPVIEPLRAFVYEAIGDQEAAAANYQAVRSSRTLEESVTMFADIYAFTPTLGIMLFGGYTSEVNGDLMTASFVYQIAASQFPDHFLLNWRLGILAEAQQEYAQAYAHYETAATNAPVPFPIARYHQALLLQIHSDELANNVIDTCTALAEAETLANTKPDLYKLLLENITTLQNEAGCVGIATTPMPADEAEIPPATEDEYLFIVADFAGEDAVDVDASRRIAKAMRGSDMVRVLGEQFRLEEISQVVGDGAEAETLAATMNAHMIIWGVYDAAGLEVVMQTYGYPDRTLTEFSFLIPAGDTFNDILINDTLTVVPILAQSLTLQRIMRDDNWIGIQEFATGMATLDVDFRPRVIPITEIDRLLLNLVRSFSEEDMIEIWEDTLTDLLDLTSNDPSLYFYSWTANFILQQYERAWDDAEHIHELLPEHIVSYWTLITTALFTSDFESVLDITEDMPVEDIGARAILLSLRSMAYIGMGDFETALNELETIIANQEDAIPEVLVVRALLYEIQGNPAAEADRRAVHISHIMERTAETMPIMVSDETAPAFALYAGYLSELTIDNVLVSDMFYRTGLTEDSDYYLLNWRLGKTAMARGDIQAAYDAYMRAVTNASVAFPVASYQLALLLHEHSDDIATTITSCEAMQQARQSANSNPDFYAILIEQIETTQLQIGCPHEGGISSTIH